MLLRIPVPAFIFLILPHLLRIPRPRPSPFCGHILGNPRTSLDYEQEPVPVQVQVQVQEEDYDQDEE